jgi:phage-related protein
MGQPPKRIEVLFFRTGTGAEPVREWLKELSRADRGAIGRDIRIVELGWPIGMPVCRALGDGLYEVRTTLIDRIARVLFTIDGSRMVLLHGFIKKSRKTPQQELDLARRRKKERDRDI